MITAAWPTPRCNNDQSKPSASRAYRGARKAQITPAPAPSPPATTFATSVKSSPASSGPLELSKATLYLPPRGSGPRLGGEQGPRLFALPHQNGVIAGGKLPHGADPPAPVAQDAERLARFQREAQIVAQMDHPGIVPIYDVGRHDGSLFFVMPVVEGEMLRGIISIGDLVKNIISDQKFTIDQLTHFISS